MSSFYEHYEFPYDSNQVHHLYDHNFYDNNQHQQFGFDPMSYNNSYNNWNGSEYEYEYETASASVAYSVSTLSEPKHLFYDPSYYTTTTTYESPPQFSIYCNVQGFNEPEFEEYDPTPYGGGYDIVATYGKPLPPSVNTCYPSSTADQGKPPSPPEIIAPVPLGIYGDGEEKKAVKKHKVEVKALYVPSGYGLEATDLCEVIFGGYFPCVLRNKRRQEDENRAAEVTCWESTDSDPWKTTSDYLFGDSYPYGYEDGVGRRQFDISSYGYLRY
ncbi:glycine-rich protein [Raphanus sativus]|nr:glycine-rich protein [Raphanus sativus]